MQLHDRKHISAQQFSLNIHLENFQIVEWKWRVKNDMKVYFITTFSFEIYMDLKFLY